MYKLRDSPDIIIRYDIEYINLIWYILKESDGGSTACALLIKGRIRNIE